MTAGDPVWYRQTCYGGYGFQRDVPATFVRMNKRRVTVVVELKDGTKKQIAVDPGNVRPREADK